MGKVSEILASVCKENRKNLLEPEAKTICQEYNIPVTRFEVAKREEEAVKFAEEIGFPVVLKIVSPDIIHKSDVGGVMLDLKTGPEVERAYRTILANVNNHQPSAKISGILVQEMAPSSTEVIIGAIKDDQFGPTLMFGLGGIFVEILKDVAFRIAPVTKQEAELMITEIKAYPVLKGYRNQPPLDINTIAEIIVNTSKLVTDHQEIKELDLNPIMVYEKGAKTVDARIILE
ncbi:acetate--CoA ligase family protein [Candidatus Bathyarchaeota archaeon]|nr:acetate--CoA ligase family protein [Candidatus Bathyarchaeota archaeon]